MRSLILFVPIVSAFVSASPCFADWPAYMHDGHRSGVADEALSSPLEPAWTHIARHAPAWSSDESARHNFWHRRHYLNPRSVYDRAFHVVGSDGLVYYSSSSDDSVRCLDMESGDIRWTFTCEGPIRNAPTLCAGRLLFGSDDGRAYCLDANDGTLLWKYAPDDISRLIGNGRVISNRPIRTGVSVCDDVAYFAAGMFPTTEGVYLCAVDVSTGDEIWKQPISQPAVGYLTVSDQWIIVPTGRTSPNAYDRAGGKLLGVVKNDGGNGGTFAVVTGKQAISGPGPEGRLYGVDLESKERLAAFRGLRLVVDRGKAYVQGDETLTAIDWERFLAERPNGVSIDACRLWETKTDAPYAMIASGDVLFLGADGRIEARSMADGSTLWQAPVSGRAYGLSIIDTHLIASTDQGVIHAFRPTERPRGEMNNGGDSVVLETSDAEPANESAALPPLAETFPDGATAVWNFRPDATAQKRIKDLCGQADAQSGDPLAFTRDGAFYGLALNGDTMLTVPEQKRMSAMPAEAFTVETWVRIDKPMQWGAIIGAVQDNGSYERGWLLGFRGDKHCLAVATEKGKMTYMSAGTSFKPRQWYHVVGTYDGETMRLYVNGKLEAESKEQSGPIRYPEDGDITLAIGAYHDDNEHYPMTGVVQEITMSDRALSKEEIDERFEQLADHLPKPPLLRSPPIVLRQEGYYWAEIEWADTHDGQTIVRWGQGDNGDGLPHVAVPVEINHYKVARLRNLTPEGVCNYQIVALDENGNEVASDRVRQFRRPGRLSLPRPDNLASEARDIDMKLQAADAQGQGYGWSLLVGLNDGQTATQLLRLYSRKVLCVEPDPAIAARCRRRFQELGLPATRITVLNATLEEANLPPYFANIVVANPRSRNSPDVDALMRHVRPCGGVLYLDGEVLTRGPLEGAGQWTHGIADPGNTACSGDQLVTGPMKLLWFGEPGAREMADRHHRNPSPLFADGRLFTPGDQVLFAQDAYNGEILWKKTLPESRRLGVFLDASNMATDGETLYYAFGAECLRFDATTGQDAKPLAVPTTSDSDWGYLAALDDQIIGTACRPSAAYDEMSYEGDSALWYDNMAIIAADSLFSLDKKTGEPAWTYRGGLILHTTISIGDGRIYFIESRRDAEEFTGRAPMRFFKEGDCSLVALDLETGETVYRRAIDLANCDLIAYTNYADGKLVLSGNRYVDGRLWYWIYGLDAATGEQVWEISENTGFGPNGGHGEQNRHPTIVDGVVYGHPYRYNLHTGVRIDGWRFQRAGHGCGNVSASRGSLFYRGGNPQQCELATSEVKRVNSVSRPGCWINMIPAGGLLMIPEASSGCTCDFPVQMSMTYVPMSATP